MTDPILKNCPFCGSPATTDIREDHDCECFAYVECTKCPASMREYVHWYYEGKDELARMIKCWNERPSTTVL